MVPSVFISYGHADVGEIDWLGRLRSFLAVFERQRRIQVWDDRGIRPGSEWRAAIQSALENADAAVLLVGPRFLASDFIANHELPHLLEAARSGGARLYPVIVGFCAYSESPLRKYQSFNSPQQPLEALPAPDQNRLMNELCIRLVQELEAAPPAGEAAISSQRRRIVEGIERERSEVVRQSSQERKGPSRVSGQRLFDMTQSFKDREAPRAELYRHLASPGAPLVTVVGRAGIGKTALVSRFVGEIVRPPDDEAPRGFSVDGIAILSRETSAITLEQVFTACGRWSWRRGRWSPCSSGTGPSTRIAISRRFSRGWWPAPRQA
jgi:hypothetical protein